MALLPTSPVHWEHKAVYAALETAFGAGAAAIAATDAVRLWDVTWTPMEGDKKELPYVKPYFGATHSALVNLRSKLSFKVGLTGAGAAAAPAWDRLVRAAGCSRVQVLPTAAATIAPAPVKVSGAGAFTFTRTAAYQGVHARTVTLTCTTGGGTGVAAFGVAAPATGSDDAVAAAGQVMTVGQPFALGAGAVVTVDAIGTDFAVGDTFTVALTPAGCTYTPSSDRAAPSLEVRLMMPDPEDGAKNQMWAMLGGRCTLKASGAADDFPYLECEVTADYAAPVTVPEVTPVFAAWPDPLLVNTENTPLFRLFGHDLVMTSFGFDAGITIEYVSRVGRRGARKSDAKASLTAKVEAPSIDSVDFFALAQSRATGEFLVQHGPGAGSAVVIRAPRWQLDATKPGEDKKDFVYDLSGAALPLNGDDDWTLFASATAA